MSPEATPALNAYQRRTGPRKMAGRYFTPPDLVQAVLDLVDPGDDDLLVDPACGDGAFLVGALRRRWGRAPRRPDDAARATAWLRACLRGFELEPKVADEARRNVAAAFQAIIGSPLDPDLVPVRVADMLLDPGAPPPGSEAGDRRVVHVGNPPYVEAKRLPVALKTRLKADFAGVAGGAPDLWLYFLHRCLEWCRPGDGLALVLPNKVLVNRQALRLRKRLLAGGQLRSILFTSHLDLFPGASVYPVALHAERPRAGSEDEAPPIRLLHPRDRAELASPPVTTVDPAVFRATDIRALFPYPEQPPLVSLLRRLLGPGGGPRLGELFDVRWTVSFHRAGLRERFTSAERPASDLARRFLGGGRFSGNGEVRRYGIRWGGWWIDYDQEAARGAGNALPDPALFDRPKVVLCQNARVARAAYDPDGLVLKDTYLAIVPKEGGHALQRSPRALVAVLNSLLSHFLYAHLFHGSHVGGGYLHFLRSFVNDLRLGDWDASAAATAAARVRALEALDPGPEIDADDTALGALVAERFGLSPDEISALLRWGEQNPLWQTRHRVGRAAKRP